MPLPGRAASSASRIASRHRRASARPRAQATADHRRGGAAPVLVEVLRGDRVESRHRGSVAVVSPSGELVASAGNPELVSYLRSSAKPFQLAPFVASGHFDAYDFPAPVEALAIMASSHSGEDRHVRIVQALLRTGGLSREILACGVHPPYDRETAERLIQDREPLSPLRHNCSGKHAAMALHARAAGWPVETYWQPEHPIQQGALRTVATLADLPVDEVGTAVDGCGVVTFAVPVRAMALAYARLADPSGIADASLRVALGRIRDAMMAHPELVAGERRRFDTTLMRAAPGQLVSKGGAEAIGCVGLLPGSHGRGDEALGLALKIEDGDGARRAGGVAACAALSMLDALDAEKPGPLADYARPVIVDPRGDRSGELRAAFRLA